MIKSIGGSGTEIRGTGTELEIGDLKLLGNETEYAVAMQLRLEED